MEWIYSEHLQKFFLSWIQYWDFEFIRNAVWAGLLSAIPCGILGSLLVINRLVFAGEGIAHSAFGGIGFAVFLGFSPFLGALGFTSLCALLIGFLIIHNREHSDAVIGAVMSISMAVGILFLNLTPGFKAEPLHYLFGNILTVSQSDLIFLSGFSLITIVIMGIFYEKVVLVSFDSEFAVIRGISSSRYLIFFMLFCAVSVITSIRITGLILFMALISIPPFIMEKYCVSLKQMFLGSIILIELINFGGLSISLMYNVPSGPCMTLLAGAFFIVDYFYFNLKQKIFKSVPRQKLKASDMTKISVIASLSFVLSLIKIQFSSGGSIHCGLIPVMLFSLVVSWPHAVASGIVLGLLKIVAANPKGLVDIFQIILEYPVSYGILGFCGLGIITTRNDNNRNWVKKFIFLSVVVGILRFLLHTLSSRIFFGYGWIPSLLYNSGYVIPTTIVGIVGTYYLAPKLIKRWGGKE